MKASRVQPRLLALALALVALLSLPTAQVRTVILRDETNETCTSPVKVEQIYSLGHMIDMMKDRRWIPHRCYKLQVTSYKLFCARYAL